VGIVKSVGFLQAARRHAPALCRASGFTLLELMVTVTILAIGAAIAAPSYSAMIQRNRAKSVASELLAALNLARSEAARRGQPVSICKSSDGSNCAGSSTQWDSGWIVFVNEDNDKPAVRDSGELVLLGRQNLPAGVTVRPNNNFANYVTYSRMGLAHQMGTFAICSDSDESKAQAIVVDLTRVLLATDSNGDGTPEKNDGGSLVNISSCESP
jgi:type IV fimbrial biogenesis protein FimT